jgi:hypothetical protein
MEPPRPLDGPTQHRRAPLRLPARIRWQGPQGLRIEMTKTADVAREGVLVCRKNARELRSRVWVVFPLVRGAGTSVRPATPAWVAQVVPKGAVIGPVCELKT